MSKITMMVGIPASGKSSYAQKLSEETGATILSSDAIRDEFLMYGHGSNKMAFDILYSRMEKAIESGEDVIIDATSINRKDRGFAIERIPNGYEICCVVMATPYNVCLERNAARERVVPQEVIFGMLKRFQMPVLGEGFNSIKVVWYFDPYDSYIEMSDAVNFDQNNKFHSFTLADHMTLARAFVENSRDVMRISASDRNVVIYAVTVHDIGKVVTKTYTTPDGRNTKSAHYYGHEHVGAYVVLSEHHFCPCLTFEERITCAVVIDNHMRPMVWHDGKSVHARERDEKLLGERVCRLLEIHYEADRKAH